MNEEEDPFSTALAYHYMSMMWLYAHAAQAGRYYRGGAAGVINNHGIRFVPRTITAGTALDVPEYEVLEELRERTALLSRLIYIDVIYHLLTR